MPLVGLCGEPKEALEKIEYMMQALSLQGQFSKEDPVQAEKNRQTEFVRITEKSAEALEALDCLIWWGSCENVLSEEADSLLEEYPRLAVIFVADSPEAVFDALTKPFFHVVRGIRAGAGFEGGACEIEKTEAHGQRLPELSVSGKPFVRRQNPGAGKGNPVSGKYAARDLGALRKEGVPDVGNARILGGKAARQVVFTRPQKFSGQSRADQPDWKGNDRAGGWQQASG